MGTHDNLDSFFRYLNVHAPQDDSSMILSLSTRTIVFATAHVLMALLAFRIILRRTHESVVWKIVWILIAASVPFFGPLLFFALNNFPPAQDPPKANSYTYSSGGLGGAGAGGIPFLFKLITGTLDYAPDKKDPLPECRTKAEAGDAKAQEQLGMHYEYGDGVDRDFAQAVHWYQCAALQGRGSAQNLLGEMYAKGMGLEQNDLEACFWFTLACASDMKFGPRRGEFAAKLTAEQRREVEKRVREWRPALKATGIPQPV